MSEARLVDIFNHDKHYRALVGWMKRNKMNAHDLCDLFAEGSTVAHEIWKLYDVEGWPKPAAAYASSRLESLALEAEREAAEYKRRFNESADVTYLNDHNTFKFVAGFIREHSK